VPGAVSFDPDASVEATGGARLLQRVALVTVTAPADVGPGRDGDERPAPRLTIAPATEPSAPPRARSALHRPAAPASEAD
jgi:hypothetical protein